MIKELLMKWNKTSVLECNGPRNSYGEKENLQWININLNARENIKQTKKESIFKAKILAKTADYLRKVYLHTTGLHLLWKIQAARMI